MNWQQAIVFAISCSWFCSSAAASAVPADLQRPSPDWRDQVIYFVLTDRFADGNPANNDQGAGEFNPASSAHYSGGDLAGIQQKLDYIQNLGATSLWLTPPVANQWWSQKVQYGGYHGYWATDFMAVDAHYGTLADYQQLSKALHQKGMYLIQDIVVNHTGNFFGYDGPYDANNTAKNFVLYEQGRQAAPSQAPFHLVNRLDQAAAKANIYHWTPPIQDPTVPGQEFRYQLANLADLNTSNPQVRKALKQSYRFWLEQVGVDAFRIDTAKYVEHDFWFDFLHAPDGIKAKARELGKQQFFTFGEVFEASKPFHNDGEQKLKAFLGSKQKPELDSVIAFPLYFDINAVLAEGRPPALLGYRLGEHTQFATPHLLPTFLNNHDTKRFLAAGSVDAFIQAYALLFTIPGIPVIYQGDEQLLEQSRQAMFAGGFGSAQDQFLPDSPMYRTIQSLAKLRFEHKTLSRGNWQLLQADSAAPGVLAYQMTLPLAEKQQLTASGSASSTPPITEQIVVLMNTADRPVLLANLPLTAKQQIKTTAAKPTRWQLLWQYQYNDGFVDTDTSGRLSLLLPARAVLVLTPEQQADTVAAAASVKAAAPSLLFQLQPLPCRQSCTQDFRLTGKVSQPGVLLQLVKNGGVLPQIQHSDAQGNFSFMVQVQDLGQQQNQLAVYAPELHQVSDSLQYQSSVTTAKWQANKQDALHDDKGPTGKYQQPQQEHSQNQMDIQAVSAKASGANLKLTLKMTQISQFWAPANGFDNVHFSIFFSLPQSKLAGARALPGLQTSMPHGKNWQLGHFMFGWGNSVFNANKATEYKTGDKLGAAPKLEVDAKAGVIIVSYQGQALGIDSWDGAGIYISTWDKTGEGMLRSIQPEPSPWNFAGASADAPKVLDDIWLELTPVSAD
ncbi:alpha-amylase family glycosyl hydrolase [Rheinheimera sp. 4Y26]|uniref:alpha-amylase family glycosyl hydrolase n=1 Tax=Rheinheimera sp. 4Y26 TaxID=2977811 RepID=UPI0021B1049B|nr:alpha-amylase family glycosyl hydrolase [Rheinheimera sp. 4Y26]MCT6698108.1 alpha-amylase family glycosyl hydrolase [Rheinheimera sp. 4Y26]